MTPKFSIEDLESLAVWMNAIADVQDTKAQEAVARGVATQEMIKMFTGKRDKAQHYAWTAREAAARLRVREKRKAFVPPTLEEVKDYAREIGWATADAEAWYNHFSFNGWKVGGKTTAVDWRAGARAGMRRSLLHSAAAAAKRTPGEDPPRWKQWVSSRRLSYVSHADSLPYMKEEFQKWLKENP